MSVEKSVIQLLPEADVEALLRFDPLGSAEDITGTSTSDLDSPAMTLGLGLALLHGEAKRKTLLALGDTILSNPLDYYQEVITNAGFELVYAEGFERTAPEPISETYFIYARRDGFLLSFDTYRGTDVNCGSLWYNWRKHPGLENHYGIVSSGCYEFYDDPEKRVWTGSHDCREALIHNISKLKTHGTILPVWESLPFAFWLLNGLDYRAGGERESPQAFSKRAAELTERRLAQCPDWVRDMVTP